MGIGINIGIGIGSGKGGAGASPLQTLLAKFAGAGDDVGLISKNVGGTPEYSLWQHIGGSLYWRMAFDATAFNVGDDSIGINNSDVYRMLGGFQNDTTPAVTQSGAWTNSANASLLGGNYMFSQAAGDYLELVTADGVEWVGGLFLVGAGAGLSLVSIDGDTTRANLLPTAQDVVDSGAFANTILVANGGTLNPTDRVFDGNLLTDNFKGFGQGHYQGFANDLTAGIHTVRLTVTGYKATASTSTRNRVIVIAAGGSDVYTLSSGVLQVPLLLQNTITNSGVWEFAYNCQPTGALAKEFIGHAGSLKFATIPTVYVDSVETVVAIDGTDDFHVGSSDISVQFQSNMRHSETGATNLGTVDHDYTMDVTTGLTYSYTLTWASGGECQPGYAAMVAVNRDNLDRFTALGEAVIQLTGDDDATYLSNDTGPMYCWDFDGSQALLMHVPDIATTFESWARNSDADHRLYWADLNGTSKKVYGARFFSDAVNYVDTEVWEGECNYRVHWFAGGANAELNP